MVGNAFHVRVSFEPAKAAASKVQALADRALARLAAVDVANEVTTRWRPIFQREMNAGLNLADRYVAEQMSVKPATPRGAGPVRAEITTRGKLTIIGHYPFEQLRAAGSERRAGRTAGRRPSGVRVDIKKGAPVFEPQWFTMRLRAGSASGDKVGLFVRTGAGSVKHLYGVSPYSLFRHQIGVLESELLDDLAQRGVAAVADTIERALT